MKLDRNINADGRDKYELRNLRTGEIVTDCGPGEEHEFFVIMLKDRHAQAALDAYADDIVGVDQEFSREVDELARRAGPDSPFCQKPD